MSAYHHNDYFTDDQQTINGNRSANRPAIGASWRGEPTLHRPTPTCNTPHPSLAA